MLREKKYPSVRFHPVEKQTDVEIENKFWKLVNKYSTGSICYIYSKVIQFLATSFRSRTNRTQQASKVGWKVLIALMYLQIKGKYTLKGPRAMKTNINVYSVEAVSTGTVVTRIQIKWSGRRKRTL